MVYDPKWITDSPLAVEGKHTMARHSTELQRAAGRRDFLGGSDARIIMGVDDAALIRLWQEKRGEIEPLDLSGNLIVQLGGATEPINRRWYEKTTGQATRTSRGGFGIQ